MTSNPLSFEETHKTAYSHGFESIYALENVDLKTVRRMNEASAAPLKKEHPKKRASSNEENPQLFLDWGGEWRTTIDSFIPREPIQVLGLSKPCEKTLFENGKRQLKDLIDADVRAFIFFKGMGQGHIDEIRQKLAAYLEGKDTGPCAHIDMLAWIRTLIAAIDRKKAYVLLDLYGLNHLISLTPSESIEARRLSSEKKDEWLKEAREKIRYCQKDVEADASVIADVLLKPWLRKQGGYATEAQLMERLDERTLENCRPGFRFLNDLFFEGRFLFSGFLVETGKGLYCPDDTYAQDYTAIVSMAHSYFYKPECRYRMDQLITSMENEFAVKWNGFDEGLITKVLRLSPDFRVRKGPTHQLMITLS